MLMNQLVEQRSEQVSAAGLPMVRKVVTVAFEAWHDAAGPVPDSARTRGGASSR